MLLTSDADWVSSYGIVIFDEPSFWLRGLVCSPRSLPGCGNWQNRLWNV